MRVNSIDTGQLKRIIFRDNLFLFLFILIFFGIGIFVLLKQNPIIKIATIQERITKQDRQITLFDYNYKGEIKHNSIVETWDNSENKMLIELFSEGVKKGKEINISIDRISQKVKRSYKETTHNTLTEKLLNTGSFFIITSLIFIVILIIGANNKKNIIINGALTKGSYFKTSSSIDNESRNTYYHHYSYTVNGQEYSAKEQGRLSKYYLKAQIIYNEYKPNKAIVFEHQSKRMQNFLRIENPSLLIKDDLF